MEDYTITLTKILGKEKNEELVEYTIKEIRKKFENIRINKAVNIVKINHQAVMIIAILKAKGLADEEIIKRLHWEKRRSYKYIVANNYDDFIFKYKEYIELIIKFVKKT